MNLYPPPTNPEVSFFHLKSAVLHQHDNLCQVCDIVHESLYFIHLEQKWFYGVSPQGFTLTLVHSDNPTIIPEPQNLEKRAENNQMRMERGDLRV